jgi:antitoxin component YwqK of YwqJK toxin-antitoxin module
MMIFVGFMQQTKNVYSQSGGMSVFELAGTYKWIGVIECGATIQLSTDSTFIYNWQQGLLGGQTKGFWRINGDKIILNSEKQPNGGSMVNNVEVMNQYTSPNTAIKISDENGTPMAFANCTVIAGHHSYYSVTDSNGIAIFQVRSVRKISISYVGYKTISYTSNETSNNWFVFTMHKDDEPYHYFTNVHWTVKSGRLYDYSIKKDKYVKTNCYKRVETPIRNNKKVVKDTLGADSLILVFYDDGKLFFTMPYVNGKQNGLSVQYHKNGRLWSNTEWQNGSVKNGFYESFYDQGAVYERGFYKNGKPEGTWEVLKVDGTIWKKLNYNKKGEWVSEEDWNPDKQRFEKTGIY